MPYFCGWGRKVEGKWINSQNNSTLAWLRRKKPKRDFSAQSTKWINRKKNGQFRWVRFLVNSLGISTQRLTIKDTILMNEFEKKKKFRVFRLNQPAVDRYFELGVSEWSWKIFRNGFQQRDIYAIAQMNRPTAQAQQFWSRLLFCVKLRSHFPHLMSERNADNWVAQTWNMSSTTQPNERCRGRCCLFRYLHKAKKRFETKPHKKVYFE